MEKRYPVMMRWLHWLMVLIILGMICSGWFMSGLDKSVGYKYTLYFWHKSFGVLVLFLLIARLLTRYIFKPPSLPETFSPVIRFLACAGHFLLYLLMVLVPASGYIMSNPHGIPFFGLIDMPVVFMTSNEWTSFAHDLHEIMAYTLLGLIITHVLAVIMHQFDKNPMHRIWRRMKL